MGIRFWKVVDDAMDQQGCGINKSDDCKSGF
ncbi:uncharacterized protein G2W53_043757 [Senna tora]|uniref:Uncharacterized protein n=1 Tax=Senna tora TaxID=362788 RepID=A0A834SJF3_9FABA|nr:uncharacterized protein G2W53_043757 [Senna tora]